MNYVFTWFIANEHMEELQVKDYVWTLGIHMQTGPLNTLAWMPIAHDYLKSK